MIRVMHVDVKSGAYTKGIREGDIILKVNHFPGVDMLDLLFYQDTTIALEVKDKGLITVNPRQDEEYPLGFQVEDFEIRNCINDCVFCFVSQMKKGCRSSLYIKDDDYRTSFLYGAYVTLSNFTEADFERIKRLRLTPLYVSVHTVDTTLYSQIIRPKKEFDIRDAIERLRESRIRMHTQLVLMPGVNDGAYLEESLEYLTSRFPDIETVTVVPVGLTAFRESLEPLRVYTRDEARAVIAAVEVFQEKCRARFGDPCVYATDEFYLLAELPLPEDIREELLDNGVGMFALFQEEFDMLKDDLLAEPLYEGAIGVVTGIDGARLLAPFIRHLQDYGCDIHLIPVENTLFGATVTVTGLLSGGDIKKTIDNNTNMYGRILVPDVVLNDDNVCLDDITREDIESYGEGRIIFVPTNAEGLLNGVRI